MPRSPRLRIALALVVAVVLAAACAAANVRSGHLAIAAASTRVAVDLPQPLLRSPAATNIDYENLQRRSVLVANLMTSDAAMVYVARHAGIPRDRIAANTRVTVNVETAMLEPDSERRAAMLADTRLPDELEVRPDPNKPTITIYAQAPSVAEAQRLADAAVPGVRDFLVALARRQGANPAKQVRLEQLGAARGAIVNGTTKIEIAILTFAFVFGIAFVLPLAVLALLRRRRGVPAPVALDEPAFERARTARVPRPAGPLVRAMTGGLTPAVALPYGGGFAGPRVVGLPRARAGARAIAARAGDWPRTTRVLPWLVAAFMVVIWLVPFNEIKLAVHLPVDLKFDRLVLPVLAGVWVLVLAGGGRDAPKIRVSPIHLAVGALIGVAFLSLVLSAHALTRTLEFDASAKQLILLCAYGTMFIIVASIVRRSEVRAFLTFTLILATICGLGTILEYRTNFNVFFWLSDKLLPGIFSVNPVTSDSVDNIGRRLIRGPGQVSLETVAMMAMALPIAITRIIHPEPGQRRWLYGLAIAVLMAAMVSTFRKTGLIAPVSVALTIAYFRRRELLKLAPLSVVLLAIIKVLSPGALKGVTDQLQGNRLGVTTVSDRTADYDAVRPDVWTHLMFGRGYGSYDHTTYRILDMELLKQIIEVGVVGLVIFVALAVVVIAVARAPIRARGADAPVALSVAAAAVCFLVVSTLFDVMSFPHVPYIFLFLAAMLAVITDPGTADPPPGGAAWRR